MSLLSIVRSVCDEVGFQRPEGVASSADQLARQAMALANKELRELSKSRDWPELTETYEFVTVAGQERYPLPDDFRKVLTDTAYQQTDFWRLRGSVTPQEWQRRRNQLLGSLDRTAFRIDYKAKEIRLNPVPVGVEPLVFEYVVNTFARAPNGVAIPEYSNDGDVSVIDEDLVQRGLKWRLLKAKGLDYEDDFNDYDGAVKRTYAQLLSLPTVNVGGSIFGDLPNDGVTDGYVRPNGFGQ